jgi:hypothetical protein
MKRRVIAGKLAPREAASHVMIRVSGKLFEGHLPYVEQLVQSAVECHLWPRLDLANLEELDGAALSYLIEGENRDFGIVSCPGSIREWMDREREHAVA